MRCPVCRNELLLTLEYGGLELDYCAQCRGVWLDAGELELLFEDAEACANFLSIGSPVTPPRGEKRRRCPICDKTMNKEGTSEPHAVVFDHCPYGDGLWFDHGELATVLQYADALDDTPKKFESAAVRAFLREMFAAEAIDATPPGE